MNSSISALVGLLVGVVLGASIAITTLLPEDTYRDRVLETKAICMESHEVISGALEDKCGRLQDETLTNFNCSEYGRCWLEVR